MSRIIGEKEYYKSNDTTIPVKWCSLEVLKYGKFSIHSGNYSFQFYFLKNMNELILNDILDSWSFGIVLWEIFSYGKVCKTINSFHSYLKDSLISNYSICHYRFHILECQMLK